MARHVFRRILLLLLSVAVLCGSLMPPALRHSHAGGDARHTHSAQDAAIVDHGSGAHRPHSHSHRDGNSHRHEGHPHSDQRLPPPDTDSFALAHASEPHVHVTLLWLEWSLPVGSPDRRSGTDTASGGLDWTLVRLVDDASRPDAAGIDHARLVAQSVTAAIDPSPDLARTANATPRPLAAHPLCDAARHERSGVQLS
ncbi:MAG TPA: hypothetical protein VML55_07865 [Planctomycetaceae bacterium]|nr:hypothetical protein [Planctomycetaceae bacterium]